MLITGILNACGSVGNNILPIASPDTGTDDAPPSATLEINGDVQTAGMGSSCWSTKTELGETVDICVDKIGLPTVEEPIITASPVNARLVIAWKDPPKQLELSVFQATARNEINTETNKFRYWTPSEGIHRELAPQTRQDITIELEPGLYVFYIFGVWESKGDASYGFLVEVN